MTLLKYPRTPHLQGSGLAPDDKETVPYSKLTGRLIVVEEKLDGANVGISFEQGELHVQSRGHYLNLEQSGGRERQFNYLKLWAKTHETPLYALLSERYVMYGEWLYAKHSVFYDALPHWLCEFDVYDCEGACFLDTAARMALLADAPIVSVPVLYQGTAPKSLKGLQALVQHSLAKSSVWRKRFTEACQRAQLDEALCWQQTDHADVSEGLYIKVEENGQVQARYKWVRSGFVQTIVDSGSHHSERPIVVNALREHVDIYAPEINKQWLQAACGGGA